MQAAEEKEKQVKQASTASSQVAASKQARSSGGAQTSSDSSSAAGASLSSSSAASPVPAATHSSAPLAHEFKSAATGAAASMSFSASARSLSSVTVEDEPTTSASAASSSSAPSFSSSPPLKECSVCHRDRAESEFSGAQLKKKGKRVCGACVSKREAAAEAAAAERTFTSRLAQLSSSTPLVTCPSCNKKQVRVSTCSACKSACCSLVCFQQHRAGQQCDAIRTMPPLSIAAEDFLTEEELLRSWTQLRARLFALPHQLSLPFDPLQPDSNGDVAALHAFTGRELRDLLRVYPPSSFFPWWLKSAQSCSFAADIFGRIGCTLSEMIYCSNVGYLTCTDLFQQVQHKISAAQFLQGEWRLTPSDHPSPAMDASRLFHKLIQLLIYYLRHVDPSLIPLKVRPHMNVKEDEQGVVALGVSPQFPGVWVFQSLFYARVLDDARRPTIVVAPGHGSGPDLPLDRFNGGGVQLPRSRRLTLVSLNGETIDEQGLVVSVASTRPHSDGTVWLRTSLSAIMGKTANPDTSWTQAPWTSTWFDDQAIGAMATDKSKWCKAAQRELEARQQPGYFHLIPAMKQALDDQGWPTQPGDRLFIATPRRGIETELTELLLLEALVEEAESGDEHAQLLLHHIEEECGAPIAEVISAQRSKLEIMLEDQKNQLLIHAEAVKRLEERGRLMASDRERERAALSSGGGSSSSSGHARSDSKSSSSSSAAKANSTPAAASAASSSFSSSPALVAANSSSSALNSADAHLQPPAHSWTQRPEFKSVESLRKPGRKKYGTIMKAALRLLHSLKPVRVNKSGGSHLVFHFHSGNSVTLVKLHAGGSKDSTKSGSYCTRLYEVIHEVALRPLFSAALATGAAAAARSSISSSAPLSLTPAADATAASV